MTAIGWTTLCIHDDGMFGYAWSFVSRLQAAIFNKGLRKFLISKKEVMKILKDTAVYGVVGSTSTQNRHEISLGDDKNQIQM